MPTVEPGLGSNTARGLCTAQTLPVLKAARAVTGEPETVEGLV